MQNKLETMLCIICYLNGCVFNVLKPEKYCSTVSQNSSIIIVDINDLGA